MRYGLSRDANYPPPAEHTSLISFMGSPVPIKPYQHFKLHVLLSVVRKQSFS